MKVSIEPNREGIAVQAEVEIPKEHPGARDCRFDLHETFNIKKLLVNGKKTEMTSQAADRSLVTPASKTIVVSLDSEGVQDRIRMHIEYEGRLRGIPEFGTSADQKEALDDQTNSRMIELASYSSWYPQFSFGHGLEVELELSLPQGWIPVCSGKKVEERVIGDRAVTHWSSPEDSDILVLASPNYKVKSIVQSGVQIEVYHTQMPESIIDREVKYIADVIILFTEKFGERNTGSKRRSS